MSTVRTNELRRLPDLESCSDPTGSGPAEPTPAAGLHDVQRQMAALIVNGIESQSSDVDALVAVPPHGHAVERLRVHASGYPARISEALQESFPAVAHVLGEGAFHALAHRYIAGVALKSYNLNDAGEALPRFLEADQLTRDLPFLPDLARLEWQVARAFHAHQQPPFDATAAADWTLDDWARVTMRFQVSVALVESDWPIRTIWECRETPIEEIDLDLRNGADRVLVYRSHDTVVCESLDDAEAQALGALFAGQTLGAVIAARGERGDNPAVVAAWFTRWMSLRLITTCTIESACPGGTFAHRMDSSKQTNSTTLPSGSFT
jgi:hypothetical protein